MTEAKRKNVMFSIAGRVNVFFETTIYKQFEFLQFMFNREVLNSKAGIKNMSQYPQGGP